MTILSTRVATEIETLSKYDSDAARLAMVIEQSLQVSDTDDHINAEDALLVLVNKMVELSRTIARQNSVFDASTSKEYRIRDL